MTDNMRPNPDSRDQSKCSECRRKKIKCTPHDRDWETTHQKCDNCQRHVDLPCGPNVKKHDDPAIARSGNSAIACEGDSLQDVDHQLRAEASTHRRPASNVQTTDLHDSTNAGEAIDSSSSVTNKANHQHKRIKLSSDEELKEKGLSKLEEVNSLGAAYVLASGLVPVSCCARDSPIHHNDYPNLCTNMVKDEFHSLFMNICKVGHELHTRAQHNETRYIYMKVLLALEKYPGLCDGRKRGALLKIARFFQETRDQDELEWALVKAAETHDTSTLHENPCPPLAISFSKTSGRTRQVLLKLWQNSFLVDEAHLPSLAVPPIQRSAQHRNAGVASTLLDRPNSITRSPAALFNQEGLHLAASLGLTPTLTNFISAEAPVDAVDIHHHTALFLAAAKGHDDCCAVLLAAGADSNRRDIHGTGILEVAAKGGHVNIVKQLVDAGAEVNPFPIVCCTSSPLQAAIESPKSHHELALYLIEKGCDVGFRRRDGKNAIELAESKGYGFLAHIMRQNQQNQESMFGQSQTFFDTRNEFFGGDLF